MNLKCVGVLGCVEEVSNNQSVFKNYAWSETLSPLLSFCSDLLFVWTFAYNLTYQLDIVFWGHSLQLPLGHAQIMLILKL